jgi:hypothetical protein
VPSCREDAIEDLCFPADVELRRGFVEQDDAGTALHAAERARQCDPLPLPAGELGAAFVSPGENRVETGECLRTG